MALSNPFRRQAAHPIEAEPGLDAPGSGDLREAYERGRRDALQARKRHPLGMTFLFLAAGAGVAVLAYAAYSGSFGRGGERLDRDLAVAADRAEPMVRDAAHDAGQALKSAGQTPNGQAPAPSEPR
ncbi:hypothetical protein [Phenylobacterium sp.]|jgi:hypothetical protein|uniref:hypothetical protein n=1 Tax=Phenylobacterium sp. TaxID=1871053 RepID=UPI002F9222A8